MLPAMKTTRTNPIQTHDAFFRWRLLQTAIRAARLCFGDGLDMPAPHGCVRRRSLSKGTVHRPRVGAGTSRPPRALERDKTDHTPLDPGLPRLARCANARGWRVMRGATSVFERGSDGCLRGCVRSLRPLGEKAVAVDNGAREVDELAVVDACAFAEHLERSGLVDAMA